MFDDIRDTFPKQLAEVAAFENRETQDALSQARSVIPNYASHITNSVELPKYENYCNVNQDDDIDM